MINELRDEDFKVEIGTGLVLVDFFAIWCGPCKLLHPVLEELASNNPNLKVIKIDVDDHEDLAREYGVISVPTLILFKNGNPISKQVGYIPLDVLQQFIENNK